MENFKLSQSVLFFEECLNNRSKIVATEEFRAFVEKISKLIAEDSKEIVIKIKPNGETCICCKRYIKGTNLQNSINFNSAGFVCSIKCLRQLKNPGSNPCSRKYSDESFEAYGEEYEKILLSNPKKCAIY